MTKVTIIDEQNNIPKGKPIEFKFKIEGEIGCNEMIDEDSSDFIPPTSWDNIELICKGDHTFYDIMFAYDNEQRDCGSIFLGYFNDGIVA